MTKEFFVNAGLEDGLPLKALEILWEGRPSIIDLIPENEATRTDLRKTNEEMLPELLELVAITDDANGEATA